jgi:hypothetical protein
MDAPVLIKPIPAQVVNEHAAFGPFDLKAFIQVTEGSPAARFSAELKNGQALPTGMICTEDGILTGIPADETQGLHEITITAQNAAGSITADLVLTIKPSMTTTGNEYINQLKTQVWDALKQNLPIPDFGDILDRPISPLEIYYLLERWGTLTMWDAFNLDPASEKKLLTLKGVSEHYNVFDRDSCLVMCPKDLFSYERTLEDGLQTARVMAQEIYKRGWTVQMAGPDKFVRAAWVEIRLLGDKHGKHLEVINFSPTPEDAKLYLDKVVAKGME